VLIVELFHRRDAEFAEGIFLFLFAGRRKEKKPSLCGLGEHLCIMGDVPAAMLYMQAPETVYEYSCKLVREIGPQGFILHSGCDIPTNAKPKIVRAMVAAALD
jgi:uroporphyrinogen-III decarboxylase